MDRLEGLIKKYGPHSCGIYDLRNVDGDIEWLISEIERLRKEIEDWKSILQTSMGFRTYHEMIAYATRMLKEATNDKR